MDRLLDRVLHDKPMHEGWLGLADPMYPPNGLQLLARVQDGLDEEDVRRLRQVEPLGAGFEGEQEAGDAVGVIFELFDVFVEFG